MIESFTKTLNQQNIYLQLIITKKPSLIKKDNFQKKFMYK